MIRLPFITRLKRLFRRKRPEANLETLAAKMREVEAKHEAASDAVLASEVRGWIAKANEKAVEATRSLVFMDRNGKISPITCPEGETPLDFDEQITPPLRLRITRFADGAHDRAHVPGAVVFRRTAGETNEYLITVYDPTANIGNVAVSTGTVIGKISPITQRKLTVILTDSGHVARVILEGDGKPELDIDCGERWSIATGDHRGETFAEIIRIANSLLRLAGVK